MSSDSEGRKTYAVTGRTPEVHRRLVVGFLDLVYGVSHWLLRIETNIRGNGPELPGSRRIRFVNTVENWYTGVMRVLIIIVFILAAWLLLTEFVFSDRSSEGLETFGDKLKDLGSRFHLAIGILAALAGLFMLVRLVVRTIQQP